MPRYESAAASSGTPFHYLPFQESKRLWKSFSLTRDVSASVCCPAFLKVIPPSVTAFLLRDCTVCSGVYSSLTKGTPNNQELGHFHNRV